MGRMGFSIHTHLGVAGILGVGVHFSRSSRFNDLGSKGLNLRLTSWVLKVRSDLRNLCNLCLGFEAGLLQCHVLIADTVCVPSPKPKTLL